jgi:hypothetical protein
MTDDKSQITTPIIALLAAVKHGIKIQPEDAQRLIDAGFATEIYVLKLTQFGEGALACAAKLEGANG